MKTNASYSNDAGQKTRVKFICYGERITNHGAFRREAKIAFEANPMHVYTVWDDQLQKD